MATLRLNNTTVKEVYLGGSLIYVNGFGKNVYKKTYGQSTFTDLTSSVVWDSNTSAYYANINNNIGDEIYVTIDGTEPNQDYSNVGFFYVCTQVSGTFSITIATPFTNGTSDSLLFLTL